MPRTTNDPKQKVNLTISSRLLQKLDQKIQKGDLSRVVQSQLEALLASDNVDMENRIVVTGKLKGNTKFIDLLKQLQALSDSLDIVGISGNLNFLATQGQVEVIIGTEKSIDQ